MKPSQTQKHQFLYRVAGKKPNGKPKIQYKCSKQQADAMAHSWRQGRPNVTTMNGEVIDLPPMEKVTVTRSVRTVWPEEVANIKADLLTRLADHLSDDMDWDDADTDPNYFSGYGDAIGKIIALAEEQRKQAEHDGRQAPSG